MSMQGTGNKNRENGYETDLEREIGSLLWLGMGGREFRMSNDSVFTNWIKEGPIEKGNTLG